MILSRHLFGSPLNYVLHVCWYIKKAVIVIKVIAVTLGKCAILLTLCHTASLTVQRMNALVDVLPNVTFFLAKCYQANWSRRTITTDQSYLQQGVVQYSPRETFNSPKKCSDSSSDTSAKQAAVGFRRKPDGKKDGLTKWHKLKMWITRDKNQLVEPVKEKHSGVRSLLHKILIKVTNLPLKTKRSVTFKFFSCVKKRHTISPLITNNQKKHIST